MVNHRDTQAAKIFGPLFGRYHHNGSQTMRSAMTRIFALAVLLATTAACSGTDEPGTAESNEPTSASVSSAAPEETRAPEIDAAGIAEILAAAVPSVEQVTVITEENDPNDLIGRPNGYASAAVLSDEGGDRSDPQPGVGWGATVEVFEDEASAQQRSDYIQGILEEAPMFGTEYHYLNGIALLRVSGELVPSVAAQYEGPFMGIDATSMVPVAASGPGEPSDQATASETSELAEILEEGFGQEAEYAWVTALVHNVGQVGEFATVQFNLYDDGGTLIASAEQVESFVAEDGLTAIGTQVEIPNGQRAASVKATLAISEYGTSGQPLPTIEPIDFSAESRDATFVVENPSSENWEDLRIGVVCRDGSGSVVGGGVAYPNLVPAGSESMIDTFLISSGFPASCTAYPNQAGY